MIRDNAGGWCDTCLCFRDVQRALTAIGMLSLFCSTIQIMIEIAIFTGVKGKIGDMFMVDGSSKEAMTYQLYIAFAAFDVIMIIFSIILLYGNERTDVIRSRKFLMPWLVSLPFYVLYESAINIYYFYHQFNDKYAMPLKDGYHAGFIAVPLVYWIVKDILLFISFVFVVMRVQSLTPIIDYVYEEQGCGCSHSAPAPGIALPAPVSMTGCAHCSKPHPQPMYGYSSGATTANVGKVGWTTSVYNQGR